MAEQTFKSPGFFEREIDLSERQQQPFGIPAAVVGTALRGPAFVPVTVGTFSDFANKFGGLDPDRFGPYAVNEFLRHKTALTYVRVLGAGANATVADITATRTNGTVKNAGFKVLGQLSTGEEQPSFDGAVTFLCAEHDVTARSDIGIPMFADNDSFDNSSVAKLVRGVVFVASGSRLLTRRTAISSSLDLDHPDKNITTYPLSDGTFKLVVSSSAGASFASDSDIAGAKVFDVSLNPTSGSYIGKVLNTDPSKFAQEKHLLYMHFPIDDEVASITAGSATSPSIAVMTGSTGVSTAGDATVTFRDLFGRFDTRYTAPKTTKFISQPFGAKEHDLFSIESLDDGAFANARYKISITSLRKSTDDRSDYGTFSVQVRDFRDTDTNPKVLEQFDNCSLDPDSEDFVGRKIGDKKAYFNHDAEEGERRIIVEGQHPNKSKYIRVVLEQSIKDKKVPAEALPFGFRGIELLKTNQIGNDYSSAIGSRLQIAGTGHVSAFTGSILPPLPFRTKVTRGQQALGNFAGEHSKNEVVNQNLYWGVKTERNSSPLNPNVSTEHNELVDNMTKFMGIRKLDALYTGSLADTFNNNKFTLARVLLPNTEIAHVTGSAKAHMLDSIYGRNASPNSTDYKVVTGSVNRVTLASLVSLTGSVKFNKFSNFAKFTTIMCGGFDGLNILDKDAAKLNDKSTSTETGGGASTAFTSPGLTSNVAGTKLNNNGVASFRTAVDLLSDEFISNHNLLAIPGQREALITDHAADKTREYGKALSLMDLPQFDSNGTRLFDDRKTRPDVEKTIDALDARGFDNNYAAAYFPDVEIDDAENTRRVRVPASIPALAALSFNDKVAFPWFAPAGFNRAALGFVKNVDVRLSAPDRDDLYDARINPIATFPRTGFVIFGQKTMQQAKSALDRVNVRRLLNECKRIVGDIAQELLFEPNTPATRQRFVSQAVLQLGVIQAQAGLENFKVVMDASNNTQKDIEENRLNGTIVVVPTRTVEFIAIDFIITNAGVEFV